MKKHLIIALIALVIVASCNKENDTDYYLRFKANGVDKSLSGYVFAHKETTGGFTSLTILGATSATTFTDYLGLYLDNTPNSSTVFTTGTYGDVSANYSLLSTYTSNSPDYEAGEEVASEAALHSVTINHLQLTITSMDNETISGTFSGDYYEDGNVQTGTKISITNGEFNAKFQ